jgi:hypothetical protein
LNRLASSPASAAPFGRGLGENAVHDFECGTIAADGQEIAVAAPVSVACQRSGFASARGLRDFDFDAGFAGPFQGRRRKLAAAAAACRWIDDRQEAHAHDARPWPSR